MGCTQELKELFDFLNYNFGNINQDLSFQEIQWYFTPPTGPTFGGIWEAGVKSVKYHLKRVLRNSSATYEELFRLLCQIECCLNSRPLCIKFDGEEDPLSPGHFLILRPMVSIPDENLMDVNVNRLTRWQYMQHHLQQFWFCVIYKGNRNGRILLTQPGNDDLVRVVTIKTKNGS